MFQDTYEDEYDGDDDDDDDILSDEDLVTSMGTFDERIPKLNTVHLTGRVGNDPEPRYFDDGKVVVSLSLASRRKLHWEERQALDVQWGEEETDWYTLEVWSGLAEFVSKFVDKGARIGVVGSLQEDEFPDKETGEKSSRVKVLVRELDILESKAEAELRRANKGQGRPSSFQGTGGKRADSGWPSSAGSGDFF